MNVTSLSFQGFFISQLELRTDKCEPEYFLDRLEPEEKQTKRIKNKTKILHSLIG